MKRIFLAIGACLLINSALLAQEQIKLYPNGPKESNQIVVPEAFQRTDFMINISEPRMAFYPAQKKKPTELPCSSVPEVDIVELLLIMRELLLPNGSMSWACLRLFCITGCQTDILQFH